MQLHNWTTLTQPWLRGELARRKAQWVSGGYRKVSYTLLQEHYGLLRAEACSQAPVSIVVRDGTVVSAKYAATAAPACAKGVGVGPEVGASVVMTPNDLFKIVQTSAYGDAQRDNICLDVRFDEATGLPNKLYRSCPWVMDDGWSVTVTNIEAQ
jgi:hypothetical protein